METDLENVITVISTPTVDTVSDWKVESSIVEENTHDQSDFLEQQPTDKQQEDNAEHPVYKCLIEIIQETEQGSYHP